MANSLMEHLPPSGWTDIARSSDIATVDQKIELVKREIELVKQEVRRLDRRINFLLGTTVTFGLALLALQVQIMLSIASL